MWVAIGWLGLWACGTRAPDLDAEARCSANLTVAPQQVEMHELRRHLSAIRPELDCKLTVVAATPFLLIGDGPAGDLRARSEDLVGITRRLLRLDFFERDPSRIIEIWMLESRDSYEEHVLRLYHARPNTPYGFYDGERGTIVVNMALGNGTVNHEMVHAYMDENLPSAPPWYEEGLASLFEASEVRDGRLAGSLNWRLGALQWAIDTDGLPPLTEIVAMDAEGFYDDERRMHYAASRYVLYYLQEQGLLQRFHGEFMQTHPQDPDGRDTLERVLGDPLPVFDPRWRRWVLQLDPLRHELTFADDEVPRVFDDEYRLPAP